MIANSSVTPGGRNAGLLFLFLSGVMLLLSIYLASAAWSLTRDGTVATGRIVAVEKRRPTVRVPTLDGKHFTFGGAQSITPFGYEVGENVPVVFRRDQPESAEVAGRQWDAAVFFAILTIGLAYFGFAGLRGQLVVGPLKRSRIGIGID